jgi:hypothetical protein
VSDVEERLRLRERLFERRVGEAKVVKGDLERARGEVASLEAQVAACEEAAVILSSYADSRQADLLKKVEVIVTVGLRSIFGDPGMEFGVVGTTRGKLAAMDFVVRTTVGDVTTETPVMDARGGGVAATAGFLLRVVLLMLRPKTRRILFLDETFAQLSAEYEPAMSEFLRELTDKTSTQIVLVTHSEAYGDSADVTYRFRLVDGRTVVES